MKRTILLMTVAGIAACAPAARAEVKLPALFSDNMVLQRDKPVPVWGWADPGATVTVEFGGEKATARADETGRWMVRLKAGPANRTGQTLAVTCSSGGTRVFHNVLVGDVWLCSGQSNMDYELAGGRRGQRGLLAEFDATADYPAIRHFAVPENSAVLPQDDMQGAGGWQVCTPETAKAFSAVGYFFGRMIHERTEVPIGLITAAVGGTRIESWTRAEELAGVEGCKPLVDMVLERARLVKAGTFSLADAMDAWFEKTDPGSNATPAWKDPALDDSEWKTMPVPSRWFTDKIEGMEDFIGVVWFRRTVDIPAGFAGKDLVVSLGMLDDRDTTFFNGEKIGAGMLYNDPRIYTVPGQRVTEGRSVIAIRLWNGWGEGGVWGNATDFGVYPEGGQDEAVPLAGEWRYKTSLSHGKDFTDLNVPVNMGVRPRENLVTGLYNGMIAPLVPFALRGAIWYQGESNGDEGGSYTRKMRALIEGWRNAWGQGAFPFYYVQLANYQEPNTNPEGGDGWARFRMAQLEAMAIESTGMAVAIDLADEGNPNDVHPENKKDVGERLALWALANQYGEDLTCSGPLYKSMDVRGTEAIIRFDYVGKGLMVGEKRGSEPVREVKDGTLQRFAISGEDGQWHWADARIEGATVVVSSPEVARPVAVRYAYSMNPSGCNLYNKDGLPASPFTTDDDWR